jgi:hypothetical protein
MIALERLRQRLSPVKTQLLNHPVYAQIDSISALRIFMEHHVFAVWDFMSLLKALQQRLTCVSVPWLPVPDTSCARLINEIVTAEESDEDGSGGYISHFEMYLRAMKQSHADTSRIERLLQRLRQGQTIEAGLLGIEAQPSVNQFVRHTFDVIHSGKDHLIAAAFTFGREDLLPGVFQRVVDELNVEAGGGLDLFRYYLIRHIGLDGDEHGPMAQRLVAMLCGEDERKWQEAEDVAAKCLESRLELWNGMSQRIYGGS